MSKKVIEIIKVQENEAIVEKHTVEIPKFVADAELFLRNMKALYLAETEEVLTAKISSATDKIKDVETGSIEYKSLELDIEKSTKALELLKKEYADFTAEKLPDAKNDTIAKLFLVANQWVKAPKEIDTRFKSIHNTMRTFYNRYNDTVEATPEKTTMFKSIQSELVSYANGIFKQEGGEEYKAHSVKKLPVYFVNDLISFIYDAPKGDTKPTKNNAVPSGALRETRKRVNTVYLCFIKKYFMMQQTGGKVVEEVIK